VGYVAHSYLGLLSGLHHLSSIDVSWVAYRKAILLHIGLGWGK